MFEQAEVSKYVHVLFVSLVRYIKIVLRQTQKYEKEFNQIHPQGVDKINYINICLGEILNNIWSSN